MAASSVKSAASPSAGISTQPHEPRDVLVKLTVGDSPVAVRSSTHRVDLGYAYGVRRSDLHKVCHCHVNTLTDQLILALRGSKKILRKMYPDAMRTGFIDRDEMDKLLPSNHNAVKVIPIELVPLLMPALPNLKHRRTPREIGLSIYGALVSACATNQSTPAASVSRGALLRWLENEGSSDFESQLTEIAYQTHHDMLMSENLAELIRGYLARLPVTVNDTARRSAADLKKFAYRVCEAVGAPTMLADDMRDPEAVRTDELLASALGLVDAETQTDDVPETPVCYAAAWTSVFDVAYRELLGEVPPLSADAAYRDLLLHMYRQGCVERGKVHLPECLRTLGRPIAPTPSTPEPLLAAINAFQPVDVPELVEPIDMRSLVRSHLLAAMSPICECMVMVRTSRGRECDGGGAEPAAVRQKVSK
jgi:hypothetical protein